MDSALRISNSTEISTLRVLYTSNNRYDGNFLKFPRVALLSERIIINTAAVLKYGFR